MVQQDEIKRSHTQGFGGSDAKMFAKIGEKGIESLSTTDTKRILMVLGKLPVETFGGNVYTEAGHLFEDWVAENCDDCKGAERERYLEREGLAKHFKVFAHADFYAEGARTVYECKYSQDGTNKVFCDYYAQLQWYYMLGVRGVVLVHGRGKVLPFEVEELDSRNAGRDHAMVAAIEAGIQILDNAIEQGMFDGYEETNVEASMMTGDAAIACQRLGLVMAQIKEAEKLADDYKQVLHDWMERNGVLNIKGDGFTVSYVQATTRKTFDAKKAQEAFPQLKGDEWYKTSAVKSSIKITFK